MIKTVRVINYLGEQLDLELADPYKSGLYVQSITGIGAGKATINVVNLASDDGGLFNSARAETRNIVLTLGMLQVPGVTESIEASRQLTYKYFPKKKWIKLVFITDVRSVYIEGYVESNEPDIFSDKETTQISIVCPDPNFYDSQGGQSTSFGGIDNLFEFPFSNEGVPVPEDNNELNIDGNVTEFGRLVYIVDNEVWYNGEVDTGVTIKILIKGSGVEGVKIHNVETGERISLNDDAIAVLTGAGLTLYDELYICTVKGQKAAVLIRNGYTYNIMNALGRNPDWFQLHKDKNVFTFTVTRGYQNVDFTIYYTPAYEGV